ncbi:hypothetical protein JZ751_009068, partial [Albula glossodonta]
GVQRSVFGGRPTFCAASSERDVCADVRLSSPGMEKPPQTSNHQMTDSHRAERGSKPPAHGSDVVVTKVSFLETCCVSHSVEKQEWRKLLVCGGAEMRGTLTEETDWEEEREPG